MKLKKDKEVKETKAQANKRNFAGSKNIKKEDNVITKLSKVEYGEFYNKNIIYTRKDGSTVTVVCDGNSKEYINKSLST
jgi:hypothetical protein